MLFRKLSISFLLAFASFAFAAPTSSSDEKYYLIYVKNPYGEYKVYQDSNTQKRDAAQVFVESTVNKINDLIVKNKNSYKNQSKLAEIQAKPQNDDTYSEFKYAYPISSVGDRVVLLGYLSDELVRKVSSLPDVFACVQNKSNIKLSSYYNTEDILNETGWKNLSVRENADGHLSLISQGMYPGISIQSYDTNYYYPASAGKGVDIIFLDSSFNFKYSEFSNTNERYVACAGNVVNGVVTKDNIDKFCGKSDFYHGEKTSDVAAGLVHGVANRANVHGISLPTDENGVIKDSDILGALQYVKERFRPNRTVINLSFGGFADLTDKDDFEIYTQYNNVTSAITKNGGIIVASAGNDGKNLYNSSEIEVPCELDSVICVGGINKYLLSFHNVYAVPKNSNFGRNVDLYAPFSAKAEFLKNGVESLEEVNGTSFSSPIVAGIIANVMSEYNGTKYTKERMLYLLQKHGLQFTLDTGNRHNIGIMVNNGKQSLKGDKIRCGDDFGSCDPGRCCNSEGWCGTTEDYCSVSKGCQITFGECN